jgi:surfactin synthase thioesterase subunit
MRPPLCALLVSASAAPPSRDSERYAGKDDDASLIADLRKQGGTPEEVFEDARLLRLTLETLRADCRICESFRHDAAVSPRPIAVHAYAGRDDDIEAAIEVETAPTLDPR